MPHITFVHGIGNQPDQSFLLSSWNAALFNGAAGKTSRWRGATSSMLYWADLLYSSPVPDVADFETSQFNFTSGEPIQILRSSNEVEFISGLALKIGGTLAAAEFVSQIPLNRAAAGFSVERVPLPLWGKKYFLNLFLRDVHHYLFNERFSPRPGETYAIRDKIRERFRAAVQAVSDPLHIVVGHSLGSVIAYDCLKCLPDMPAISNLVTIGSPLGFDEIQDELRPSWSREDGYPSKTVLNSWINVFDRLDPVDGFDPFISDDYMLAGKPAVKDIEVTNEGAWRHSILQYLSQDAVRNALVDMLSQKKF
ncbi:lipase family protein [Rhizobium ruizarguesonis]|uniref:hypothetical protein n=1 Tax=Rhizobium ruizarguesonis TaxID=2081791 RepID=UPI00102F4D3D|nr:hypothetical protein [Rhizobium ruizarguesonis]TBA50487.1 hypothetical protein ELH63_23840 [Rhizobium ruizarguesonis]